MKRGQNLPQYEIFDPETKEPEENRNYRRILTRISSQVLSISTAPKLTLLYPSAAPVGCFQNSHDHLQAIDNQTQIPTPNAAEREPDNTT